MKFVDPLSPLAGNARSHAVPNAVWHASRHACFLSLGSLAHRVWHSVTPVNSAHTSTHVFFESDLAVSVTRPEPGRGRPKRLAYLSRDAVLSSPPASATPLSFCENKTRVENVSERTNVRREAGNDIRGDDEGGVGGGGVEGREKEGVRGIGGGFERGTCLPSPRRRRGSLAVVPRGLLQQVALAREKSLQAVHVPPVAPLAEVAGEVARVAVTGHPHADVEGGLRAADDEIRASRACVVPRACGRGASGRGPI